MNNATNQSITNQSEEQIQIIHVEDEGSVETMVSPEQSTSVNMQLLKSTVKEDRNHGIRDFMERLYEIDNFTWSKTATRGEVLKTYRFPDKLLALAPIAAKTRNFFGFRAGVELVVLVNKQPFQAGNLMISFLPNAKYNKSKSKLHSLAEGIVSRSGAPRTNLDLMDGTRANLEVPYVSPFVYYNLMTGQGTIGDFIISVYSPLTDVAASGTVSVQVMARFIDVDLQFPTGLLPTTYDPFTEISQDLLSCDLEDRQKITRAQARLQRLLEAADNGTLHQQMNQSATIIKQKALPNMANSDGSEFAHNLSISKNNSLKSMSLGHAGPSEMDLRHIISIPNYHNAFTISKSNAGGSNVWSSLVSPNVVPNIPTWHGLYAVDYFNYFSQLFQKWRGSVKYSFRAVKTQFHSCRVRVWFCPGATGQSGVDRNACYSKIVDLKELNTFEFECPFVYPMPWLEFYQSVGVIGVDVLNALVSPDTVADNFEVIVERSMGADFQFNLVAANLKTPVDPSTYKDTVKKPVSKYLPCDGPDHTSFCCREINPEWLDGTLHHQIATQSNQDAERQIHDDNTFVRPQQSIWADQHTMGQAVEGTTQLTGRSTKFLTKLLYVPPISFDFTLAASSGTITADGTGYAFSGTAFEDFTYQDTAPGPYTATKPFAVKYGELEGYLRPGSYMFKAELDHWTISVGEMQFILITKSDFTTALTTTAFPATTPADGPKSDQLSMVIQPHAMPQTYFDDDNNITTPTYDTISYLAPLYTFYRGGMNLKFITGQEDYTLAVHPYYNSGTDTVEGPTYMRKHLVHSFDNTMAQVVRPSVEGFGEFHIPYYATSFCTSIDNDSAINLESSTFDLRIPQTSLMLEPRTQLTPFSIYRSTAPDFEFFYLSGAPMLY